MVDQMKYKKYILQEKISNSKIPTRIFRKELQEGYKEIDLPSDKEIIINHRTGIPFLKTKDNGKDFIFCYWDF